MEMVMKKRVLVVDDEEGIRLLYKEELEEEGCEVEIAASGEEAIERLESDSIDLVLLDLTSRTISAHGHLTLMW
jgi:CheY-like chemotaxis protein